MLMAIAISAKIPTPFVSFRDLQMYYEIRGTGQRLLSISVTGGDLQRSPTILPFSKINLGNFT